MTCSCVWHDLFIYMTGPIHIRDRTHVYISHSYVCDLSCSWRTSRSRYRAVAQMTHLCVWHDAFMCVTWLIHVCDMTHSCVWHDSFMCDMTHESRVTYLIYTTQIWAMTYSRVWHDSLIYVPFATTHSYVWHDSFTCVTCSRRQRKDSYVWHDSFMCVTWLIIMCDMTHLYVWHDSFICVTLPIHKCDMTHSYVWHDSLISKKKATEDNKKIILDLQQMRSAMAEFHKNRRVLSLTHTQVMRVTHERICKRVRAPCSWVWHMNEPCYTYEWVKSHIWMSHVTNMNESCHTYEWVVANGTYISESCHTRE